MSTQPPRIFVSSVIDGFEAYRAAARRGIEAADALPIMAEDWPSQSRSSRTACLDLVATSDAFLLVVGERGGWAAPSGLLVVEEELQEARRRKLPIRVVVQSGVDRDAAAETLVREVSDYVQGFFRRTFDSPEALATEVERAVTDLDPLPAVPNAHTDVRSLSSAVHTPNDGWGGRTAEKTLRFVLAPERSGEVIDPRKLDDPGFHHAVMSAAQHPDHQLLTYGQPVVPRTRGNALLLEKTAPETNWRDARPARIEVHESGLVVIDVPMDAPAESGGAMGGAILPPHILDEERVEKALTNAFRFSGAVYDLIDEFHRFDRFRVDVALSGVEGAVLERSPQPRSSYTIPQTQRSPGPLMPYVEPRVVNRNDLNQPGDEVSRLVTYIRRALSE